MIIGDHENVATGLSYNASYPQDHDFANLLKVEDSY